MELKLFSGRGNLELSKRIAKAVGCELGKLTIRNFADGEIFVKFEENIRGADVFVIQSTQPPADNLMELLLIIDAAKRASAQRITAVIPYYGYGRQDKKDEPRVPISAKLVADLLTTAGADRVLTLDLHADQIQGYFNVPLDHLLSTYVIVQHFKDNSILDLSNTVVVAPDVGGTRKARHVGRALGGLPIAIVDKWRPAPNMVEVMNVIGDVEGKEVLIVDDIIDTGGTIANAAKALKERGAKKIYCWATHALLSGRAVERVEEAPLDRLYVSDSIPLRRTSYKIEVVSVAELLGEAIVRIHEGRSVSSLFV